MDNLHIFLGATVADAATRPLHWVYDPKKMKKYIKGKKEIVFLKKNRSPFYNIKTGKVSGYNDIGQVMFQTLISSKKKSEIFRNFKKNIINTYKKNAKEIIKKIKLADNSVKSKLKSVQNKPYIVFHDAYQYFEKAYGLNAIGSILIDPEQPPSPNRLIKIRSKIKTLKAHCVFKEPQFKAKIINTVIEDTDAKVGTLDPLGADLEAGPNMYVALIENLSNNLVDCLGK